MSMKEAHHIYTQENEANPIGLSTFCELCLVNIKLFDKIPHIVCFFVLQERSSFAPRTREVYQFISWFQSIC